MSGGWRSPRYPQVPPETRQGHRRRLIGTLGGAEFEQTLREFLGRQHAVQLAPIGRLQQPFGMLQHGFGKEPAV